MLINCLMKFINKFKDETDHLLKTITDFKISLKGKKLKLNMSKV